MEALKVTAYTHTTSELNKTGTLPPHKLAYNQLRPNFMSRHACLDINSRVYVLRDSLTGTLRGAKQ